VRVRIEPEVLADPTQFGRDIAAILERCDRGQHRWVIDDIEAVIDSPWMKSCPRWPLTQERARKAFDEQIYEPSANQRDRLMVVSLSPRTASTEKEKIEAPQRAREILEHAVQLLLENSAADWHFLCAISTTYPREALLRAIGEKWIIPAHAGGKGEFRKRFDELIDRGVPPWRIAVLMDSDRLKSGPLPRDTENKQKQLEELGARVFTLFKREAENYLPPSSLSKRAAHHDTHSSFRHLSPEQRDHYDMKHGFKREASGKAALSTSERELFGEVNPWHLNRLVGGFGSSIGDSFKAAKIDREEMDEVCATCPGELEEILLKLEEML
jgi:hypothetical protein